MPILLTADYKIISAQLESYWIEILSNPKSPWDSYLPVLDSVEEQQPEFLPYVLSIAVRNLASCWYHLSEYIHSSETAHLSRTVTGVVLRWMSQIHANYDFFSQQDLQNTSDFHSLLIKHRAFLDDELNRAPSLTFWSILDPAFKQDFIFLCENYKINAYSGPRDTVFEGRHLKHLLNIQNFSYPIEVTVSGWGDSLMVNSGGKLSLTDIKKFMSFRESLLFWAKRNNLPLESEPITHNSAGHFYMIFKLDKDRPPQIWFHQAEILLRSLGFDRIIVKGIQN